VHHHPRPARRDESCTCRTPLADAVHTALLDRYGRIAECEQQVGAQPVQVCHEGNTAVHATLIQMIATSVAACTCQVRGYVAGRIGLGVAAAGSARAG
jgi:hypothetical protein